MKKIIKRTALVVALFAVIAMAVPCVLRAQPVWFNAPSTTPDAQRSALQNVRAQISFFQNTTRTAPGYVNEGYAMVWQGFQAIRGAYGSFKSTLTPNQLAYGANDLADLDAGLDIIQEAFGNFQEDVNSGQSSASSFRNLCQVLSRATAVWLQQFNKVCARLRVGW